jgi:PhoH-like ATPase
MFVKSLVKLALCDYSKVMKIKKDKAKTFVIDTNVFIHRPDAIYSFRDSEIVIPVWVLEELDKLKNGPEERARNARSAIRIIDNLAKKGSLYNGVKIAEIDSYLRIELNYPEKIEYDLDLSRNDNKIILCALGLQRQGKNVFFVSKDINARVKAIAVGLHGVDYEKQKINIDTLYSGYEEWEVSADVFTQIEAEGVYSPDRDFLDNQFVQVTVRGQKPFFLMRYNKAERILKRLPPGSPVVTGIRPLNIRQQLAFDLLLDPSIQLVTLVGKAGTGKTLLAIAAGLSQVMEQKIYSRLLVSRPVIPMGKDIGYLPGGKDEKLANWMLPLFDNLDFLTSMGHSQNFKSADQLIKNKVIEIEALTFIRGRSLPKQFIIIDEAQNLSPHEVKTIVSRAGRDSKMVLTGDPYQIDNPYLDAGSNGLSYLVESFKGQSLYGHVTLDKSERSPLAELAAEIL